MRLGARCLARLAFAMLSLAPLAAGAAAQTTVRRAAPVQIVDEKDRANLNTVTIVSGTPAGTYLAVAYDMAAVLDDGDNLRVLAIAGKGSVQNVRDILNLRGVDMGIVQSDVMTFFKRELGAGIDQRIVYITKLYNEEMHLVANAEIKDIKDLAGKKVNFAEVNSGTQFSSRMIFELLGIKVEEVNMGQSDALVKIKSGEIAASVFIVGRPAAALAKLPKDPSMHLLAVPYTEALETNSYLPAVLTSQDYPGLVADGGKVETIAVGAVLAVYNWPVRTDRHRRVSHFVTAFFDKFGELQKAARHPKWKEVNLAANLKGWNRFPPAKVALDKLQAQRNSIDVTLARQQAARAAPDNAQEQERLFQQFMDWSRKQERR